MGCNTEYTTLPATAHTKCNERLWIEPAPLDNAYSSAALLCEEEYGIIALRKRKRKRRLDITTGNNRIDHKIMAGRNQ